MNRNALLVVLVGVAFTATGVAQNAETYRRQSDALRAGGLRSAAAVAGSFEHGWRVEFNLMQDAEALAKGSSTLIVVASVRSDRPHLGPSETFIVTEYELNVHEYIKGGPPVSGRVFVDYRGGRVTFENGTWASDTPVNAAWRHPKPGERMLLFLSPLEGRYVPHSSADGVDPTAVHAVTGTYSVFFEKDGKVEPALGSELFDKPCSGPDRIFTWSRCQSWTTFIETIKRYVSE